MENVVKHIVINKLYDIYDYDIPFDRGCVALITGPNGFGKTTLLEIIKNALSVNFWYFYDLLFPLWAYHQKLDYQELIVLILYFFLFRNLHICYYFMVYCAFLHIY